LPQWFVLYSFYIPLAETNGSGVITDLRNFVKVQKGILDLDGVSWDIRTVDGDVHAQNLYGDGSNITGIQAQVGSTSSQYMLGSAGTPGQGFSINPYEQLDFENEVYFGSATRPFIWQKIYGQGAITSINLILRTVGSPDDNVFVEIQTDNAWFPSGTVVAWGTSQNIPYTDISSTFDEETFNFTGCTLEEWVPYHVVIKRDGSNSDVNRYFAGRTILTGTFIGSAILNNGTSWVWASGDLFIKIPGYTIVTPSNAVDNTNFIGVLQLAGSAGDIRTFNKDYDNNQSGLTAGEFYGLGDNGTFVVWGIFKAISTTEIAFNVLKASISNLGTLGTFWESVDALTPVRIGTKIDTTQVENNGTTVGNYAETRIGYSTTYRKTGQSITIAGSDQTIKSISAYLYKNGTASGNLTMKIYSDTSGTLVATSQNTISEASASTTPSYFTFSFNNEALPAGVYYVSLETDKADDTSNFINWLANTGNQYTWGISYYINSSDSWVTGSSWYDKQFTIQTQLVEDGSEFFKSDVSDPSKSYFNGFTLASKGVGEVGQVITNGIVDGLSDLSPGEVHYLSDPWYDNIVPGTAIQQLTKNYTTSNLYLGYATSLDRVGQNFLTNSTDGVLNSITVALIKVNSPTSNITCKVYEADKLTLVGTATNEITPAEVTTSVADYTFNFDELILDTDTEYFYELDTSALSTNHYYRVYGVNSNAYTDGNSWRYVNGTWTANTQDCYFDIDMSTWDYYFAKVSTEKGKNELQLGIALSETELYLQTWSISNKATSITMSRLNTTASGGVIINHW